MNKNKINVNTDKQNTGWLFRIPITAIVITAIITLSMSVAISFYKNNKVNEYRQKISYVSDTKQNNDHIERSINNIKNGSIQSFSELKTTRNNMEQLLSIIKDGGSLYGNQAVSSIESNMLEQFNKIDQTWQKNKGLLDKLITQEMNVIILNTNIDKSQEKIPALLESAYDLQKLMRTDDIKRMNIINEIFTLSNNINIELVTFFSEKKNLNENSNLLVKNLRTLNTSITNLKNNIQNTNDQELLSKVNKLQRSFEPFLNLADSIEPQIQIATNIKISTSEIINNSNQISANLNSLNDLYIANMNNLDKYSYIIIILILIGVTSLGLISLFFFKKEKRTKEIALQLENSQNNQKAVDLLLEQIKPMDKGDFTHRVYVSDKFVTQIAEKIDNTREVLGNIVRKMKTTSISINENANDTDLTSKKLLEVSDMQYIQIEESIKKLGNITAEMDEVAQTTWFAQEESNQSKDASLKGKELVDQSMNKMNEIKNNIQESSKKIKKSSESAQAISEVAVLVNNITKQIGVLALNATILAASSGDAGKEFTVVAKEVQRLAIDSKNATQQIVALVKIVQEDINIAVSSMEKTTQEVIAGSKLTNEAGQALIKIEMLSNKVAKRVREASTNLEAKSSEMTQISIEMKDLQSTTEESKEIVQITVKKMELLKKIAKELNDTIDGYKIDR